MEKLLSDNVFIKSKYYNLSRECFSGLIFFIRKSNKPVAEL